MYWKHVAAIEFRTSVHQLLGPARTCPGRGFRTCSRSRLRPEDGQAVGERADMSPAAARLQTEIQDTLHSAEHHEHDSELEVLWRRLRPRSASMSLRERQ